MAKSNKPVKRFRIGYVEASIWENESGFHTVVLSRTYKVDDEYRNTDNLSHGDLLNACEVLRKAEAWLSEH